MEPVKVMTSALVLVHLGALACTYQALPLLFPEGDPLAGDEPGAATDQFGGDHGAHHADPSPGADPVVGGDTGTGCIDDPFEPNDSTYGAHLLSAEPGGPYTTVSAGVLCPNSPDHYRARLVAGQGGLSVRLGWSAGFTTTYWLALTDCNDGDLQVVCDDWYGAGDTVCAVQRMPDNLEACIEVLGVTGADPRASPYTLEVTAGLPCGGDAHELNNTLDRAYPVASDAGELTNGALCRVWDTDVFLLPVSVPQDGVGVHLSFSPGTATLSLSWYDGCDPTLLLSTISASNGDLGGASGPVIHSHACLSIQADAGISGGIPIDYSLTWFQP